MKKALVLGFYHRCNLGDDMFMEAIPLLLKDFQCTFECMDDYDNTSSDYDVVICGGGDIFNDYFLPKIQNIKSPIYLVGVGIPYESMITTQWVNMFDHIFLRNTTDISKVSQLIGYKYVHYLP